MSTLIDTPLKTPLQDSFGRVHQYLRISVTDRCNFRCQYCMPAEGIDWKPRQEILTYEEIERLARLFVAHGVTKIRITGGEPTSRAKLPTLIQKLADIPGVETLSMTTNGFRLAQEARIYKDAGLSSLNISLDTLKPERFLEITRRDALAEVLAGIEAAQQAGFSPLKVNVVVMAGVNEDEILDFVAFVRDKLLNVRFIEFMPFKSNQWQVGRMIPYADIKARISEHYRLIPIDTETSAVAKDFQLVGHTGSVSFITSMSEHFCGTCNRVRLTADGSIKPCLLHPAEISLRDAMRAGADDEALSQLIQTAIWKKPVGHEPLAVLSGEDNRSMIQIGG